MPPQHMGACLGRSTDTALDTLIKQIQDAWLGDNGSASLLSINMTWAFDIFEPVQLLHNLRKNVSPISLISSFPPFLLILQQILVFPASLLVYFCLSKGFPKTPPSWISFSSFTMPILLTFAMRLIPQLLALVLLMMQQFWLLERALMTPALF